MTRTWIIAVALVVAWGCSKGHRGECDECGPDDYCENGECIPYCDPPCPPGWYCYHPTGTCFYGSLPDGSTDSGWEPVDPCGRPDRDGDFIPDAVEGETDNDGDTIPNLEDLDSDGDTILDFHEAGDMDCTTEPWDDDGDGKDDYLDLDSDGDGIPDAEEAGDDDPDTRPRDTDGWGHADFKDTDSDNDGLGDAQEIELGTDRLMADTDGDGYDDMQEVASLHADPLSTASHPEEGERIFTLFYRGRSAAETFTFQLRYRQSDVMLVVDATYGSSAAVRALGPDLEPRVIPEMDLVFEGLRTGVAQYTGWRMPDVLMEASCRRPFQGLARISDAPPDDVAAPYSTIPRCPEPLLGSSLVEALFQVAGDGTDSLWPGPCTSGVGGACFGENARRIVMLVASGEIPESTPPGYGPYHSLDGVTALMAERGIRLVGLVAADSMSDPAYAALSVVAQGTGTTDLYDRPLVYLLGSSGADASTAVIDAAADAARRLPEDVTLEAVDGEDWPETTAEFDASAFVMSLAPGDWSPPPDVSPFEACAGVASRSFLSCVPDTRISYQAYYRNYSLEQDVIGRVLAVTLELASASGYLFERVPVRFIVPALDGDSVEE